MVSSKVNTSKSDVVSALLKETSAQHVKNLCSDKEAQNKKNLIIIVDLKMSYYIWILQRKR